MNDLPQTSQAQPAGEVCVLVAVPRGAQAASVLASIRARTPAEIPILELEPSAAALNAAIAHTARADVVIVDGACGVGDGWIERLREAARADTNTATASAFADSSTPLAIEDSPRSGEDFAELSARLSARSRRLRPRLRRAVGPCVYVRREALELVGPLDEQLDLRLSLELDFAQRCLLSGLAHVAADDVLAQVLDPQQAHSLDTLPAALLERYPYLESSPLAESEVLAEALQATRNSHERLDVTIDARALDGAVTGTQVHIVELINALALTEALRLRLLVRTQRIDPTTLSFLRELPGTEVLPEEELDEATKPSTVYHRPQQIFATEDLALAMRLGEHLVLSQLDLIAYRNPGYFPDEGTWEDYRRASRRGLAAAERVVVFSEHTRRELLGDALVEAPRIRMVPPGLDHRTSATERPPASLEDEESLGVAFLLCLGTDFRHKNRLFALRLLASLRVEHGWMGTLVLAGTHISHGSSLKLERAYLQEHPELADAVKSLGAIDEQEKAWLMARASAVVYPSAYEGFGLVPFESALAGVPCLFAPQSSLAEAAPGETATIVPWEPAASAAAAYRLLSDPELRAHHVQTLVEEARALTWQATAERLVEIYREAAGEPAHATSTLSRDALRAEERLTEAHEVVVNRLIGERVHAQRMYDELNTEVGSGLSLIGPNGALPESLQRALLAISARPGLARPLFAALGRVFIVSRKLARVLSGSRRSTR